MLFYTLPRLTDLFLFALDDAPSLAKPKLPVAEEWTPQVRLDEERGHAGREPMGFGLLA